MVRGAPFPLSRILASIEHSIKLLCVCDDSQQWQALCAGNRERLLLPQHCSSLSAGRSGVR